MATRRRRVLDWLIVAVLYVLMLLLLFRWLGGFASAGRAFSEWGRFELDSASGLVVVTQLVVGRRLSRTASRLPARREAQALYRAGGSPPFRRRQLYGRRAR